MWGGGLRGSKSLSVKEPETSEPRRFRYAIPVWTMRGAKGGLKNVTDHQNQVLLQGRGHFKNLGRKSDRTFRGRNEPG